jgi:LPS-assembly protein
MSDVPFPARGLTRLLRKAAGGALLAWTLAHAGVALAVAPEGRSQNQSPMHWSGDQTFWDRKTGHVRLIGHATVNQPGETLTAHEIELDLNSRMLDARGDCVYIVSDSVVYGEEMHFNLETRTGTIIGGRVSGARFTLSGERINKLGDGRFQTHRGEYTTCWDCPASWTLRGDDVDLEFGGYAYMSNVTAKVKDAPIFWLPYLIVPIKTERQTGFLFPRFRFGQGFRFVQPFFWAISRGADMTIGAGQYGGQGPRVELEGRYRLSDRSYGTADFYYLRDHSASSPTPDRWALSAQQFQELPFGVEEKLRLLDVSDNEYPASLREDVPGYGEAYIASDLIFSHSTNQVSAYVAGRRIRNLLDFDSRTEFDPKTVQVYPTATVTTNDKILLEKPYVAGGLTLGVTNFTRTDGAFDLLPPNETFPGGKIIRKATRATVVPTLYTTFRPFDFLTVTPSAEYRSYFYSFHNELPALTRSYLLVQTEASTQLERIYETDDPEIPRIKHLIRPLLTYSLIPFDQQSGDHPFSQQLLYANNRRFSGFNFDSYDIVPITSSSSYANYFTPLGHSLQYGLSTQLIRRRGAVDAPSPSYQRIVELRAGQAYDFKQRREAEPKPFTRFFSSALVTFDSFEAAADYFYEPYAPFGPDNQGNNLSRHYLSTRASYIFERATHQSVLSFDRSISLGYSYSGLNTQVSNIQGSATWSVNDYILPSINASYNALTKLYLEWGGSLSFQHPSRCWRFGISAHRYRCVQTGLCTDAGIDLSLNLTGAGFGGVSELASTAMTN